jgi:PAS domain S-box-containing protein
MQKKGNSSETASIKELKERLGLLSTERDELLQKNQQLQEIAIFPEQNPTPIVRVDFEGNNLYKNNAAKELLKTTIFEDHQFWTRMYIKMEANAFNSFTHEVKIDQQLFEVTLVPIVEKKYFNIYFRDITETVRYQNELLTTNVRLNSLLNSLQSAVVAEDRQGNVLFVNARFCRFFHFKKTPTEIKGSAFREVIDHATVNVQNATDFIARLTELKSKKTEHFGEILHTIDGKVLEFDAIPIIENGMYSGQIWKFQDITEIVNNRETLYRIEDKYRRIIEDLEFGLVETDLNEVITKVYPAFCKLTGYTEQELVGKNARLLLSFEENKHLLDIQNEFRRNGESSVYEVRLKTKNDLPKWCIISGTPIYNEHNEVVGSIAMHLDITERKKLEEELKLANEQANSSVKAKEKFIANMSHEIRTPMNVILGMSELLQQNDLSNEQRKYVEAIHKSADNLLGLITDILDFSKIESGYFSLEPLPTSLSNLLELIAFSFAESCEAKGVQLEWEMDRVIDDLLWVDANKLNQVFLNLVGNAVKFTDEGKVEIVAKLLLEDETTQTIQFAVRDSGIGIEKENYELVFQSFRQEDESISRNYGGTGLGLAITKRIVELMNSKIFIESEKNKGSLFYFEIVFNKVREALPKSSYKNNAVAKELSQYNILVAEDNPMNQMLIQSVFLHDNIPFHLVNDGHEVMEIIQNRSFDIILMDIQMPKMDGLTTVRELRARNYKMPVLALTANVSPDEISHYIACGMSEHVPKPFKREELYRKMLHVITSQKVKENASLYRLNPLEEIANGDSNFIQSILETFIEQVPKHLNDLKKEVIIKNGET